MSPSNRILWSWQSVRSATRALHGKRCAPRGVLFRVQVHTARAARLQVAETSGHFWKACINESRTKLYPFRNSVPQVGQTEALTGILSVYDGLMNSYTLLNFTKDTRREPRRVRSNVPVTNSSIGDLTRAKCSRVRLPLPSGSSALPGRSKCSLTVPSRGRRAPFGRMCHRSSPCNPSRNLHFPHSDLKKKKQSVDCGILAN